MKVGVARETAPGERRVALVPEALGKLKAAGLEILVEAGAGDGASIPDSAYAEAGATVVPTDELYAEPTSSCASRSRRPAEVERLRRARSSSASSSRSSTRARGRARATGRHGDQPRRDPAHAVAGPDDGRPRARRPTSAATRRSSSQRTPTGATSRS